MPDSMYRSRMRSPEPLRSSSTPRGITGKAVPLTSRPAGTSRSPGRRISHPIPRAEDLEFTQSDDDVTVFALVAALAALRIITALVLANGVAALAVAGISWPITLRPESTWVTSPCQFSLKVAVGCLASAITSWVVMPSAAAIRRRDRGEGPGRVGATLLRAGLAI